MSSTALRKWDAAEARANSKRTLTLNDRCDRCRAAAYVKATVNGVNLLFCGHHFHKHEDAVRQVASEVMDERHFIEPNPAPMAAKAGAR